MFLNTLLSFIKASLTIPKRFRVSVSHNMSSVKTTQIFKLFYLLDFLIFNLKFACCPLVFFLFFFYCQSSIIFSYDCFLILPSRFSLITSLGVLLLFFFVFATNTVPLSYLIFLRSCQPRMNFKKSTRNIFEKKKYQR